MARGFQPPPGGPGISRNSLRSQVLDAESQGMPARRAGLSLPLNTLAIPVQFFTTPDRETVEEDGETLFQHFVEERLESVGISEHVFPTYRPEAGDYARAAPPVSTPDGYRNSVLAECGRNLRALADSFAQSEQNVQVRSEAESVPLEQFTREEFLRLLRELFMNGFSKERLIALFFFCMYLIMRAITEKREHMIQDLFVWSLQYIKDNVCNWVYEHGGWAVVLNSMLDFLYKTTKMVAICVAIFCGIVYIKNNVGR